MTQKTSPQKIKRHLILKEGSEGKSDYLQNTITKKRLSFTPRSIASNDFLTKLKRSIGEGGNLRIADEGALMIQLQMLAEKVEAEDVGPIARAEYEALERREQRMITPAEAEEIEAEAVIPLTLLLFQPK